MNVLIKKRYIRVERKETKNMENEKQDRINEILRHKQFLRYLKENEKAEENRVFCKHQIEHFLDVARIAYIKILEEGKRDKKELVYAIALLHDIGKHRQYFYGTPHEVASAELSEEILVDCGYEKAEREQIKTAILNHRTKPTKQSDIFSKILYEADKQSRNCFFCKAKTECHWSEEKKNKQILL